MNRSTELGTPLRRWLRSARTRRQLAKALGGDDNPPDAYMRMATAALNFLWTDAINQPHTDPTWNDGRGGQPMSNEPRTEPLDVERVRAAFAAITDKHVGWWTIDMIWPNGDDVLLSEAAKLFAAAYEAASSEEEQ